jgi:hypothetical protein
MRELEIWFKYCSIINTENMSALTFHSKEIRVPLRPQITFKNIKITHQSGLRFLGTYIKENVNWGAHVQLLRTELCKVVYMIIILKETMSPHMMRNIYYSNLHSCLRCGIIL